MAIFQTKIYWVRLITEKNSKFKHMTIQLSKMKHTEFQNENMYQ